MGLRKYCGRKCDATSKFEYIILSIRYNVKEDTCMKRTSYATSVRIVLKTEAGKRREMFTLWRIYCQRSKYCLQV
jgi:hypothetical protein